MNEPLTVRQQAVLDFLREFHIQHGYAPSSREIQRGLGFSSASVARHYLAMLEQKGAIERQARKARGLTLRGAVQQAKQLLTIPLYGTITAGFPSDGEQRSESCITMDANTLHLPVNARTFALKVQGDSMIGANIMDGDSIILEFRDPRPGDIVAALIDGETTLKRYVVKNRRPFLRAENPRYPDLIPAQELVIQGVMVALLRVPHAINRKGA